MRTLIATAFIVAALLSAGAFANGTANKPAAFTNVTVINKNQAWPPRTQMTVEPCKLTRCYEI